MVTCYIGNECKSCLDAIVPQSVPRSVRLQSFPVELVEWLWSHLVAPQSTQRYSTSVSQDFYKKEGRHCCVGKMGGGTLNLRVSVQVKNLIMLRDCAQVWWLNLLSFIYLSIQIWSLLLFWQTKVSLQLLLPPLQLLSAHWWCSSQELCVVLWSLSASAGGIRRDVALSQHQTHKNNSKQLQCMRRWIHRVRRLN